MIVEATEEKWRCTECHRDLLERNKQRHLESKTHARQVEYNERMRAHAPLVIPSWGQQERQDVDELITEAMNRPVTLCASLYVDLVCVAFPGVSTLAVAGSRGSEVVYEGADVVVGTSVERVLGALGREVGKEPDTAAVAALLRGEFYRQVAEKRKKRF